MSLAVSPTPGAAASAQSSAATAMLGKTSRNVSGVAARLALCAVLGGVGHKSNEPLRCALGEPTDVPEQFVDRHVRNRKGERRPEARGRSCVPGARAPSAGSPRGRRATASPMVATLLSPNSSPLTRVRPRATAIASTATPANATATTQAPTASAARSATPRANRAATTRGARGRALPIPVGRFVAARDVELAQDLGHVELRAAEADSEARGDLVVGVAVLRRAPSTSHSRGVRMSG